MDVVSIEELTELFGDMYPEFVGKFYDAYIQYIGAARSALASNDSHSAYVAIHTLKGTAGTVGAVELVNLCLELEIKAKGGSLEGASVLLDRIDVAFQKTYQKLEAKLKG